MQEESASTSPSAPFTRLLSRLQERLETFTRTQVPAVLRTPDAESEARELLDIVHAQLTTDFHWESLLEASHVLGMLHWLRHQHAPEENEDELLNDRTMALNMFQLMYQHDPERLPQQAREALDALNQSTVPPSDIAASLNGQAMDLLDRWDRGMDKTALLKAVVLARRAVFTVPESDPEGPRYLNNCSAALQRRFQLNGNLADLDDAVSYAELAVARTPADQASFVSRLLTLGGALELRFRNTGRRGDLDSALAAGLRALSADSSHPRRAAALANQASLLTAKYELDEEPADLTRALEYAGAAVTATPADSPDRALHLGTFAATAHIQFVRTGHAADLDAAAKAAREAVDITPDDDLNRAAHLNNLGGALHDLYEHTGDLAQLDASLATVQQVIDSPRSSPWERTAASYNLALGLRERFDQSGDLADISAAVGAARRAAEAVPAGHPAYSHYSTGLATQLLAYFERTGDLEDLRAAVSAGVASVEAAAPHDTQLGLYLNNLGLVLQAVFERTGDSEDLLRALKFQIAAVNATPKEHHYRALRENNLTTPLVLAFLRTRDERLLKTAAQHATAALDRTPPSHPGRIGMLRGLGAVQMTRFRELRDDHALSHATRLFKEAAELKDASPGSRLVAARAWGEAAAESQDWQAAHTAYSLAVHLLPLTAWHGLDRNDREFFLSRAADLACDAAAVALLAGAEPERALELLETGRGLLLSQALDARSDLAMLRRQDPVLAQRMDHVRRELDAAEKESLPASPSETADPSSAELRRSQRRRALGKQWDDLLLKARALPGLDSFLKPQTFESLRHAADDGPVVTVNVSRYRCDALILRQDGLTVLPLRDLSHTAVRERALALDEVLRNRSAADAHAEVRATLSWLWKVIAEPVTGMLGLGGGPPVRMWWCTTGMLTFLPVHAAGRYPGRTTVPAAPTTLLDLAVSSYTPTLRALVDARLRVSRRRPTSRPAILAVAVPEAEGLDRLPHATAEIDRLRDLFPEVTTLVGQDATRTAILAELPGHDWLHFAGHGSQDLLNPGSAALYCHDHRSAGPLTALAVSRLRLHDAELAFLSACETARGSAELTDESAHIAGALNIAGFPHVIATQWEISDTRAPFVAEHVYRCLTADDSGAATARDTARALHSAVNALRSLRPDAAALWAPYIHTGP